MTTEITGRHVFAGFASAFAVIIGVNLTLAYNAVQTFPGLEVKNSYVASQAFDADRAAQQALGWDVAATLQGDRLHLSIMADGKAVFPVIESATFGRATSVAADQTPAFTPEGDDLVATVNVAPGNWNLRLVAQAADGTMFRQRIVVGVAK